MSHNIMVVDDSRVVFAEMKKMLDGTDIEIVSFCRSGEEALQEYGQVKPDLVTMDIIMPGMDGMEAAQELLQRWPDAKVLMVSSLAYDDMVSQSSDIGTKGFLFKPFERESLIEKLHEALRA